MRFLDTMQKHLDQAEMSIPAKKYLIWCTFPALLFSVNLSAIVFFLLGKTDWQWIAFPLVAIIFLLSMLFATRIPKINTVRIGKAIEADIFVPSRMLVTLLESGNSLVTAFDRVSKTNTVAGKYFGKISAEIYLGKSLDQAINAAITNTPSKSFKRVLEPIKNSLRTGAAIEKNLLITLEDLTAEKALDIERYGSRLAPVSMFYMIFGAVLPTVSVVAFVIILSVAGITMTFFPFMFILLILIAIVQFAFFNIYKSIRPVVKL